MCDMLANNSWSYDFTGWMRNMFLYECEMGEEVPFRLPSSECKILNWKNSAADTFKSPFESR